MPPKKRPKKSNPLIKVILGLVLVGLAYDTLYDGELSKHILGPSSDSTEAPRPLLGLLGLLKLPGNHRHPLPRKHKQNHNNR